MDFDSVLVNGSADLSLTIRNRGRDTLVVSEITVDGAPFSVNFEEVFSLEPDSSRDFAVTFTPDTAGVFVGTLTIVSNDPDCGVCVIGLIGVGVALGVGDEDNPIPARFYLSQAHPNPFNSSPGGK
jgi:hypothetical protein